MVRSKRAFPYSVTQRFGFVRHMGTSSTSPFLKDSLINLSSNLILIYLD
ncbi:MAG: hypothetical protein ACLFT1_01715 [Desulfonatronovibrio sp.]